MWPVTCVARHTVFHLLCPLSSHLQCIQHTSIVCIKSRCPLCAPCSVFVPLEGDHLALDPQKLRERKWQNFQPKRKCERSLPMSTFPPFSVPYTCCITKRLTLSFKIDQFEILTALVWPVRGLCHLKCPHFPMTLRVF